MWQAQLKKDRVDILDTRHLSRQALNITAGLKEYTFIDGEKDGFNEYWKQVCVERLKF